MHWVPRMRSSAWLGILGVTIFACSAPSPSGLDGDWPAGDSDAGTSDGAIATGDASTTSRDAAIDVGPDGSGKADSGAVEASAPLDAAVPCLKAVASPGNGHHHPGADCMSCHDGLSANKRWTVAGTLYTTVTGGTAISGASIDIVDAANKKIVLATTDNGNFYTTQPVTFPLTLRASKCPNDAKMNLAATTGSCNANSCHNSTMRVHLP